MSSFKGFWDEIDKPIIGLSPMDGVTDQPFRHIQKKYGRPDVVYTEFTSVEGLCHGATKLLEDFLYDETQRPIVAQIYGTTPEFFRQASIILCQLGFDGIDINMGCPAKNVAHAGAGAALIQTPKLAQDILRAAQQGVQDWLNGQDVKNCQDISAEIAEEIGKRHSQLPTHYQEHRQLPVSVKTRVGYDKKIAPDWVKILLETEPAVIAIHGRTLKQQYSGLADWDEIGIAAEIIKETETLVLGNGDVSSREDAVQKTKNFNLDGVLIGRASFGNPLVFLPKTDPAHAQSTLQIALEHSELFEETFGKNPRYTFLPMRKHMGWYVKNVPGARQIRAQLFQANSTLEVANILKHHNL